MARARNIKPGFFKNPELVELRYEVRLLFIGLWTMCDREGRMEDRPKKIKMELFPADNIDIDAALSELHANNFVLRYEVNNIKLIQVVNFLKHQKPHHQEKASELPPPLEPEPARTKERVNPSDSLNTDSLNTDCLSGDTHTLEENPKDKKTKPPDQPTEHRWLTKFPMDLDWQPDEEILTGLCCSTGFDRQRVTTPLINKFKNHYTGDPKHQNERQWQTSLINWAKSEKPEPTGPSDPDSVRAHNETVIAKFLQGGGP